jgi:hypothetical protein
VSLSLFLIFMLSVILILALYSARCFSTWSCSIFLSDQVQIVVTWQEQFYVLSTLGAPGMDPSKHRQCFNFDYLIMFLSGFLQWHHLSFAMYGGVVAVIQIISSSELCLLGLTSSMGPLQTITPLSITKWQIYIPITFLYSWLLCLC